MESLDQTQSSDYDWYGKAKDKIESLLPKLDPDLTVEITSVTVTPTNQGGSPYKTLCLRFSSSADPALTWTMEIRRDDQYIEEELPNIVRKIYQEKRSRS